MIADADDELPALHEFVLGLAMHEDDDEERDAVPDAASLRLDALAFDLPVELTLRHDELGLLMLRAAPPTQRTETTIMPVWHRLRLTVEAEHDGAR